jgi:hypothetical protein
MLEYRYHSVANQGIIGGAKRKVGQPEPPYASSIMKL